MAKLKMTDSDLLHIMSALEETDYYFFGGYTEYDGLDVPNLKCICGYAKDVKLDNDTETENP